MLDAVHKGKLLTLACAALFLGGAQQSLAADANIPELSGVWQWGPCYDGSNFGCLILEEDSELLTDRAKAYRDAIDETAQPKYDCAPISIPHMWTDPYSHMVEQFEDRVVFTYGKDDVVRTAWLEGHGHPGPAVNEFTYFGHSTAHYEDGALIVETTHFSFDPQGLNADFKLASSTQKKVTERYTREGDDLVLEVTTVDPFFLKEPWVYKVRSRPDNSGVENPLGLPWACDVDASRDWLEFVPSQYTNDPPIEYNY
jgi:hypothetical protein